MNSQKQTIKHKESLLRIEICNYITMKINPSRINMTRKTIFPFCNGSTIKIRFFLRNSNYEIGEKRREIERHTHPLIPALPPPRKRTRLSATDRSYSLLPSREPEILGRPSAREPVRVIPILPPSARYFPSGTQRQGPKGNALFSFSE